jgi:hypothetical protein
MKVHKKIEYSIKKIYFNVLFEIQSSDYNKVVLNKRKIL